MFNALNAVTNRFSPEPTAAITEPTCEACGESHEVSFTGTLADLVGHVITPLALAPATLLAVIGWHAAATR